MDTFKATRYRAVMPAQAGYAKPTRWVQGVTVFDLNTCNWALPRPAEPTSVAAVPWQRVVSSVQQFSERHPAFTQPALRSLIHSSEPRLGAKGTISANGLAEALIRRGRRVFIDEARFFAWLDVQSEIRARQLAARRGPAL